FAWPSNSVAAPIGSLVSTTVADRGVHNWGSNPSTGSAFSAADWARGIADGVAREVIPGATPAPDGSVRDGEAARASAPFAATADGAIWSRNCPATVVCFAQK